MNNNISTETNDLFAAISKAQADIKVAVKDASNPFFKSKYANLQMVMEASRPALCKNNLMVVQQIVTENDRNYLVTTLGHASGQWISSRVLLVPAKSDVQSLGSYITYMRRYCYSALVGVCDGDSDDDGNSASHIEQNISKEQITILVKSLEMRPNFYEPLLEKFNINELSQLKESQFKDAVKFVGR